MLLLPCTFIYSLRLACCVCVYACVYACVRDHKRASIHVWSLCLYSTMHMHQLSYDKSTDFVSIFFLSIFFFSFSPSLLPYLPTSLLSTHSHSLSLSPSVFRLFFLAFLRLAQHIRVRVSRFPVCTRTRLTHRQLQPLSVLFYSHPRRSIVGFFVTVMV